MEDFKNAASKAEFERAKLVESLSPERSAALVDLQKKRVAEFLAAETFFKEKEASLREDLRADALRKHKQLNLDAPGSSNKKKADIDREVEGAYEAMQLDAYDAINARYEPALESLLQQQKAENEGTQKATEPNVMRDGQPPTIDFNHAAAIEHQQ